MSTSSSEIREIISSLEKSISGYKVQITGTQIRLDMVSGEAGTLKKKIHENKLELSLHHDDPDYKKLRETIRNDEKKLSDLNSQIEHLQLKLEALNREKSLIEPLDDVYQDFRGAQAEELAAQVPELLVAYDMAMEIVRDTSTKIKVISLQCRELGHTGPLKKIDPQIFSLIQQLPLHYTFTKWAKGGTPTLTTLHFTDANKDQIINEILGK